MISWYNQIHNLLKSMVSTESLLGKKQVSKAYEYYLKHSIKEKLQTLTELELPLLIERGMIQDNLDLSVYSKNLSANWLCRNHTIKTVNLCML